MDKYEWDRMSPKVREKYLQILRDMPPGKKLRMIAEHNDAAREFMKAGMRARNPGIREEDVRKELIRLTLPPDIVKKVYGWEGYPSLKEDERETGRKCHEYITHILDR